MTTDSEQHKKRPLSECLGNNNNDDSPPSPKRVKSSNTGAAKDHKSNSDALMPPAALPKWPSAEKIALHLEEWKSFAEASHLLPKWPSAETIALHLEDWKSFAEVSQRHLNVLQDMVTKAEQQRKATDTVQWLFEQYVQPKDTKQRAFCPECVVAEPPYSASYNVNGISIRRRGREACIKGDYDVFYDTLVYVDGECVYSKYDD